MAAGLAALRHVRPSLYSGLERNAARLENGLRDGAADAGVAVQIQRVGSMMGLFFLDHAVRNYGDARSLDTPAYARFFWALMRSGVYLPPAPFETAFLSAAHTSQEIDHTVEASGVAFQALGGAA